MGSFYPENKSNQVLDSELDAKNYAALAKQHLDALIKALSQGEITLSDLLTEANNLNVSTERLKQIVDDLIQQYGDGSGFSNLHNWPPTSDFKDASPDKYATALANFKSSLPQEHQYNKLRNALRDSFDASGVIHWGRHGSDPINQGMYTNSSSPNALMWGGGANGDSETAYPVINVAGHEIHVRGINHSNPNTNRLVFQDAENGTRTVNTSTGVVTQHADATTAFAAAAATNVEVIVRRVDLKFGEAFLEVDPDEMFPYGMCKSGLASIDGIATEPSSRPDSYHAAYAGEVVTNKQCIKVAKLTFVQLAKLMSNPKNNWFYNDDGALTQVRYRDKAARGAGNGDWLSIDPNVDGLKYSQQATVVPQGMKDLAPSPETTDKYIASPSHATATFVEEVNSGVYIARNTETGVAYKGECYALVLCTVPRLNQGMASHINAFGTKKASDSKSWHETTVDFSSLADCFNPAKLLTASGEIGTPSGHQDGLLHNAIYASGFNGVIDHRQPAKSPQDDWKESLQGFYAAKVRGVQKLPFTKADSTYVTINWNGNVGVYNPASMYFAQVPGSPQSRYLPDWKVILLTQGSETVVLERDNTRSSSKFNGDGAWPYENNNCYVINVKDLTNKVAEVQSKFRAGNVEIQVVVQNELDTSVSGAFSCNTVIADPANWVQTPQIAQGIVGVWCPVIPDGTSKPYQMVRKCLDLPASPYIYSRDSGATWTTNNISLDSAKNSFQKTASIGEVAIVSYKAYAYQVEDGYNLAPVGGEKGYGRVFAKQHHLVALGCLTIEGFIHKVVTNDNSKNAYSDGLAVLKANLHSTGRISTGSPERYPLHQPLDLLAPTNNSPACKALPFIVEKNGYLYIAWHVNELGYTNPPTISTVSGTANFAVDNHSLNRVDGGSMNGVVVMRVGGAASNTSLINCFVSSDGAIRNADGTDLTQWWVVWNGSGWGDDSKIKVTSKGWDTFVDLNGNKMTRRVVISTFPIGPAKKKTLVGGLSSPA